MTTAASMTDLLRRVPPHVAVFLGLSTAGYAVSLAGVTALQAHDEAILAAERAPSIATIQDIAAKNASFAAALATAGGDYQAAVDAYTAAGGRLADLEASLAGLASSVKTINGVTTNLPTSVALPKVTRHVSSGTAPATSSTTGASGAP
jgi:hypothetical protein